MDGPRFSRYLTKVAHGCTPLIGAFLSVHLSSPALASLGSSSLSSRVMLLGREYYQTAWGEPIFVLGPIVLHVCAGVVKRLLSGAPREKPRPFSAVLAYTGYAAAILFLPMHYLTHRIYPMSAGDPIDAIGPAELDYEFVKYGLQRWPVRTWLLYGGLASCVILHGLTGAKIIWQTWFGGTRRNGDRGKDRKIFNFTPVAAASSILVPVLVGIYRVSQEPLMALSPTITRFEAVFKKLWLYRI